MQRVRYIGKNKTLFNREGVIKRTIGVRIFVLFDGDYKESVFPNCGSLLYL